MELLTQPENCRGFKNGLVLMMWWEVQSVSQQSQLSFQGHKGTERDRTKVKENLANLSIKMMTMVMIMTTKLHPVLC